MTLNHKRQKKKIGKLDYIRIKIIFPMQRPLLSSSCLIITVKTANFKLGMVAHACNPSYSGG